MTTKTFEHEYNSFINEYEDKLNIYIGEQSNEWLRDELETLFNDLKSTRKINISSFFQNIRYIIDICCKDEILGDTDILSIIQTYYFKKDNSTDDIVDDSSHNIILDYFNDVKTAYKDLPEDKLEFCEENRDAIIKSNLKMVISIAKRYQNRGLSLEDLIGAGNVGLCTAWDKYNPNKNILREKILDELEFCPEEVSKDYIDSLLSPLIKYGDIKEKYDNKFHANRVYTRKEVMQWIIKNIKKAKFSSVAALWIRAYILQELDGKSRVVKKPKREIDRDYELTGCYAKEQLVYIDTAIDENDNKNNTPNISNSIELSVTNDIDDEMDNYQDMVNFKSELNKLFTGIGNRDRRIIFKSFGIGLPRSVEAREIAELENLSVARVSQIIIDCIEKMKNNARIYNLSMNDLLKYLKG